ncbi:hypothetical protein EAH88_01180 [Rhodanobacter glycinis]|uniref:Uncharacterized protein n=2 Tax=Rhodanobacter glycinis TaxID=582702 RepID=A0A502CEZ2_9GAMM|nr:hypothetical protein EAH88_01180 [Rhodanobacter glycinis]
MRVIAWLVFATALLNTLYYVLRTSNPVIRSDAWYFLDSFLSKAANGSLGLADFFVKRTSDDHAQPLLKVILLLEWRYFHLDFMVEAVAGVLAAAACAMILIGFVMTGRQDDALDNRRYLAWSVMCVLLFSLNAVGIWTWSLVAIGYVTVIPILLFMGAAWQAQHKRRYVALIAATLLLGIIADDSALITVVAVILALLLVAFCDRSQRSGIWRTIIVIGACLAVVRIGYSFAPMTGGASDSSISAQVSQLVGRLSAGDWWKWFVLPLSLPVVYEFPGRMISSWALWPIVRAVMVTFLLAAHVAFWWRAWRGRYNLPMFVAVCLMLLSYAWLAGILLVRVAYFGSDYLYQDRYIQLFQFNLVALLLMWAAASKLEPKTTSWRRTLFVVLPTIGCLVLLLVQIPLSYDGWQRRKYLPHYYQQMAIQIGQLAVDPANTEGCLPELVVCGWSLETRKQLVQFLRTNQLNVFSPTLQARYDYLPRLPAATATPPARPPASVSGNTHQ